MDEDKLSGRKRKLTSMIEPLQQKFVDYVVPRIPKQIETYHLTLMTLPLSLMAIMFGYMARVDPRWIWGISMCVVVQYVTDILDGAVGRYRNTGLVKWGFFMDHMMDFVFAYSVLGSYIVAYSLSKEFFILATLVLSGFFVHEFLKFIVLKEFNTSGHNGFGPSEVRLGVVLMNLLLPFLSERVVVTFFSWGLVGFIVAFVLMVIWTQYRAWKADMSLRSKK